MPQKFSHSIKHLSILKPWKVGVVLPWRFLSSISGSCGPNRVSMLHRNHTQAQNHQTFLSLLVRFTSRLLCPPPRSLSFSPLIPPRPHYITGSGTFSPPPLPQEHIPQIRQDLTTWPPLPAGQGVTPPLVEGATSLKGTPP